MTISLRLNEQEASLMKEYAELKGLTMSNFLRKCAMERIEDDIDLRAYRSAEAEYKADPTTYTLDEVEKELGFQ